MCCRDPEWHKFGAIWSTLVKARRWGSLAQGQGTPHLPEQFGVTLGKHHYTPAPHCLSTVNTGKPDAGVCNLPCAPSTNQRLGRRKVPGLQTPGSRSVCTKSLPCAFVSLCFRANLSPLARSGHALLRQAGLWAGQRLRECW